MNEVSSGVMGFWNPKRIWPYLPTYHLLPAGPCSQRGALFAFRHPSHFQQHGHLGSILFFLGASGEVGNLGFFNHAHSPLPPSLDIKFHTTPPPPSIHIYTSIHLFIYSSIHLFIYTSIHLYIYTSIHLYIYISIHLYDNIGIVSS